MLLAAGSAAIMMSAGMAHATEKVADFTASGFLFKDSVNVIAQEDPQVQGVTIYISDFQRSITDRLSKDFFDEPSQASVTCALTGKLEFDEGAIGGKDGQEVFSERKGINFLQNKTLRVRRVWDPEHKTLLYIAYSTHTTGGHHDDEAGRYRTSICALPLAGNADAVPAAQ